MRISASLILLITLQQSALLLRFHAFWVHCHYVFNWLNVKRWEFVLGFSSELCTTSSVTLISENEPVNQPQINFNYESLNESVKSSQTWRVMKVQGQRPSSFIQQRLKCDLSNLSVTNVIFRWGYLRSSIPLALYFHPPMLSCSSSPFLIRVAWFLNTWGGPCWSGQRPCLR